MSFAHSLLDATIAAVGREEGWSVTRRAVSEIPTLDEAEGELMPAHWILVQPPEPQSTDHGWKLHVSAVSSSAHDVLRRCLPVLVSAQSAFKIADETLLRRLNQGTDDVAQIGKFITAYPGSAAAAKALAEDLHAVTQGCKGPVPPSDLPWTADSVVSYRYGAFESQFERTLIGSIEPVLLAKDGTLRSDKRLPHYRTPDGVAELRPEAIVNGLLAGRFLLTGCLSTAPRGEVHDAIDVGNARTCILKRAPRHRAFDVGELDARRGVLLEQQVLDSLRQDSRFPRCYEVFEHDGDTWLVEEYLPGERLDRHVHNLTSRGALLGKTTVQQWVREILAMLRHVENRGWIYGDLTTGNILVDPDGHLRLIDFELVEPAPLDTSRVPDHARRGTRGYLAPCGSVCRRHRDGRIYSFGALIYFLLTGAEPSRAPRGSLLSRPIEVLHPRVDAALSTLARDCLTCGEDGATAGIEWLEQSAQRGIGAAGDTITIREPQHDSKPAAPVGDLPARAAVAARRLGDAIVAAAEPLGTNGSGRGWCSPDDPTGQLILCDINSGDAGVVLALAELVRVFDDDSHRDTLRRAAESLRRKAPLHGAALNGLYVGESGIGCALLHAGQVLHDPSLIEQALDVGRIVAAAPHTSPDLFHGSAGRLKFHVLLADETGDEHQIAAARKVATQLARTAFPDKSSFRPWTIPPGYASMSGPAYYGVAHGAAGIIDALADSTEADVTPSGGQVAEAVNAATKWLCQAGVPIETTHGEAAIAWPTYGDDGLSPPFWCHGAGGIAAVLARVGHLKLADLASETARLAGAGLMPGAASSGPSLCHGLAGVIDALLDLYLYDHGERWATDARVLGELLMAFLTESRGQLVSPSDTGITIHAGYMTGYSGLIGPLLRLAHKTPMPALLSRGGFASARVSTLSADRAHPELTLEDAL
jgi:tRNA A-37 threonylcarbamoyl transferase component Bud32